MSALPVSFEEHWREVFKDMPVVLTAKELEPVLGLSQKTIYRISISTGVLSCASKPSGQLEILIP